jgi:hypothetical protein
MPRAINDNEDSYTVVLSSLDAAFNARDDLREGRGRYISTLPGNAARKAGKIELRRFPEEKSVYLVIRRTTRMSEGEHMLYRVDKTPVDRPYAYQPPTESDATTDRDASKPDLIRVDFEYVPTGIATSAKHAVFIRAAAQHIQEQHVVRLSNDLASDVKKKRPRDNKK